MLNTLVVTKEVKTDRGDRSYLATGSQGGVCLVYDLIEGRLLCEYTRHSEECEFKDKNVLDMIACPNGLIASTLYNNPNNPNDPNDPE